jgi:maleylpyruvate isomerase
MSQDTTPTAPEGELLPEATQRLVRTVDGLTGEQLAGPSLLPGWTRAHVVAHLALNAEGLAAALEGVAHGESVPMYASQQDRDGDIATLAAADPAELRERFLASTTRFGDALAALPEDRSGTRVERTPGGPTFRAGSVAGMRWREVEIHHADLDAGYGPSDWPLPFSVATLTAMTTPGAAKARDWGAAFVVHAVDADREWTVGAGEPTDTVTGRAADLAWWLTGRGRGAGLRAEHGDLPHVPPW